MICTNCGATVVQGRKFCSSCGAQLDSNLDSQPFPVKKQQTHTYFEKRSSHHTDEVQEQKNADVEKAISHTQFTLSQNDDIVTKMVLALGVFFLLVIAFSTLLHWVKIFAGGITGISGDGKIILILSVVLVIFTVISFFIKRFFSIMVLISGAWGTVVFIWFGSIIWRVANVLSEKDMLDNPFAQMFASQISPGAGLYVGLIASIGVSGSFVLYAVRHTEKGALYQQYKSIFMSQAIAIAIGFLISIYFSSMPAANESVISQSASLDSGHFGESLTSTKTREEEKAIKAHTIKIGQTITIEGVRFTPKMIEMKKIKGTKTSLMGDRTSIESNDLVLVLTCVVENASEGQVFSPVTKDTLRSSKITDNFGNVMNAVAEGLFEIDEYEFEGQKTSELKPGERLSTIFISDKPKTNNATSFTWTIYLITNNEMDFNEFMPPEDKATYIEFASEDIQIRE
jgi:hypothetical protein